MKNTKLKLFPFPKHYLLLLGIFFFAACQSFQPDESTMRLHDLWGLTELNGQRIDPREQGAVLELYVADQRFLLSANSKSYQGKFRAGTSKVAFSKISPALSEASSLEEKELILALQQAERWTFEKRSLSLHRADQVIARFVKMD